MVYDENSTGKLDQRCILYENNNDFLNIGCVEKLESKYDLITMMSKYNKNNYNLFLKTKEQWDTIISLF